jgi:hypothetical protein
MYVIPRRRDQNVLQLLIRDLGPPIRALLLAVYMRRRNFRLTITTMHISGVVGTDNLYGGRDMFKFVKRVLQEIAAGWNSQTPLIALCSRLTYLGLGMIAAGLALRIVGGLLGLHKLEMRQE